MGLWLPLQETNSVGRVLSVRRESGVAERRLRNDWERRETVVLVGCAATLQCYAFFPPVQGSFWNFPAPLVLGRKWCLCQSSGMFGLLETLWVVTAGAGRCNGI